MSSAGASRRSSVKGLKVNPSSPTACLEGPADHLAQRVTNLFAADG